MPLRLTPLPDDYRVASVPSDQRSTVYRNNRIYNRILERYKEERDQQGTANPLPLYLADTRWRVLRMTRHELSEAMGAKDLYVAHDTIKNNEEPQLKPGSAPHHQVLSHFIRFFSEHTAISERRVTEMLDAIVGSRRRSVADLFYEFGYRSGLDGYEEKTGSKYKTVLQRERNHIPFPFSDIEKLQAAYVNHEFPFDEKAATATWETETVSALITQGFPEPLAFLLMKMERYKCKSPHVSRRQSTVLHKPVLCPFRDIADLAAQFLPDADAYATFRNLWERTYQEQEKEIEIKRAKKGFRNEWEEEREKKRLSNNKIARALAINIRRPSNAIRRSSNPQSIAVHPLAPPATLIYLVASDKKREELCEQYKEERRKHHTKITSVQDPELLTEHDYWGVTPQALHAFLCEVHKDFDQWGVQQQQAFKRLQHKKMHDLANMKKYQPQQDVRDRILLVAFMGQRHADAAMTRLTELENPQSVRKTIARLGQDAAMGKGPKGHHSLEKKMRGVFRIGVSEVEIQKWIDGESVPTLPLLEDLLHKHDVVVSEELREDWSDAYGRMLEKSQKPLARVLMTIIGEHDVNVAQFCKNNMVDDGMKTRLSRLFSKLNADEQIPDQQWEHLWGDIEQILLGAGTEYPKSNRHNPPRWTFVRALFDERQNVQTALKEWRKKMATYTKPIPETYKNLPGILQEERDPSLLAKKPQ